eukprot:NODE_7528_length_587_cov_35.317391_g7505_i0.p2 GENE.NODE_7528_length_587_cov_35.317391_g7505_i0~~NODE_7528_length_587_cov_35.317391_g7505_i0.p2  ORF type:complete len:180 (+),score=31.38 NODE_7528_length_587_cov_35.317391_g7505_i0:73-540(+)
MGISKGWYQLVFYGIVLIVVVAAAVLMVQFYRQDGDDPKLKIVILLLFVVVLLMSCDIMMFAFGLKSDAEKCFKENPLGIMYQTTNTQTGKTNNTCVAVASCFMKGDVSAGYCMINGGRCLSSKLENGTYACTWPGPPPPSPPSPSRPPEEDELQ